MEYSFYLTLLFLGGVEIFRLRYNFKKLPYVGHAYINIYMYIHSFIMRIYIAPFLGYYSEVLLTKKNSFQASVECVRMNPGEQAMNQ